MALDAYVTLGSVTLQGFAVPQDMPGGGTQKIHQHIFIGGAKRLDPLGYTTDDITFTGRFRGKSARAYCGYLDTLAASGAPVIFKYYTFRYSVMVESFKWKFERFYEIVYTCKLVVIANLALQTQKQALANLDAAIDADLALATFITTFLTVVNAALEAVALVRIAMGVLQGLSKGNLAPLTNSLGTAAAALAAQQGTFDTALPLTAAGGVVAGGVAATMAIGLSSGASNLVGLAATVQAGAVVGRMATNVASAHV